MGRRERLISRSILSAVFSNSDSDSDTPSQSIFGWVLALFSLFEFHLARWDAPLFTKLRTEVWKLSEDEYKQSFDTAKKKGTLSPVGDLGYSGSTFFTTPNSKYLIKSLPRHFEHAFFKTKLLAPYATHMTSHPSSLLIRITNLLYTPHFALGRLLRTAPSHHIIMENILYGKDASPVSHKWETYDLKPIDYFYPERDIAGGALASESVKERLVDNFEDKIRVAASDRAELLEILEADTTLLATGNAVDYSLFIVRYPVPDEPIPSTKSRASPWRSGLKSRDGKWVYRAVILDFFWAKDALQAQAMTGLIKGYNIFDQKGPMSITTTPEEYRKRFMKMVGGIVEAPDQ